jgi:hypothetical protein
MRLEVRIKNRSREGLRNNCPQLPTLISEWESNKEIAELELWRIHHMAQVCLIFLDGSDHQLLYERASDLRVIGGTMVERVPIVCGDAAG